MNWKEEVEILFQDFENEYVTESEMREQIEEWHRQEEIPEDDLEEVYVRMDYLLAEMQERSWENELSLAYANYDGETDKDYVN